MIVIVAPYCSQSEDGSIHLGASRKLEIIVSVLARLNLPLVLVNSAHNGQQVASFGVRRIIIGNVNLVELTPPISSSSLFGKAKNLFELDQVFGAIKNLGTPQLIWLYNGYAFEMRFASKAHKVFISPMILEFEDWHFSRNRFINPKPFIDYFLWRISARYITATFAVNSFLADKMRPFGGTVKLLPGLVPVALAKIATEIAPFSSNADCVNIGFFGGLSIEKGADLILQLAELLPPGHVLHVTGVGPLRDEFIKTSQSRPNSLLFHGRVDDVSLYKLIAKCDVILNPHISIENMNNGIFPFKVIEAIASGRLLISTAVPSVGLEDLMLGAQFVDHSVNAFFDAILTSRQYYLSKATLISQCAVIANERFGEGSLLEDIVAITSLYGA